MKRHRIAGFLKFVVFGIAAAVVMGFVTLRLWNWLLPPLFGWRMIGFWQALGLLLLGRILFGGFRGFRGGPGMYWRRRMMERWEQMTPEEREKFRQGMSGRCGFGRHVTATPTATAATAAPEAKV